MLGSRAASGFPAPPLPPLRDPGSSSRAPGTQFSWLLSPTCRLRPRSLSLSAIFTHPPSALHLHEVQHRLHHHRCPKTVKFCPRGVGSSREFSAENQQNPIQRGRLSWRSGHMPEHPGSLSPDGAGLALEEGKVKGRGWGREKQVPGEGVTERGDTGDGDRGGATSTK